MKRLLSFLLAALCLVPALSARSRKQAQPVSFILMGDIHYCEERFYDLDSMLLMKPGDWRQITKTYVPLTAANWDDQIAVIKRRIERDPTGIKAIVQLGDLSEGLANVSGSADEMARNAMEMLERCDVGVPWLLVKGNHDITGVGDGNKREAKSAFVRHYTPFIREQTGSPVQDGNYTWQVGDVLFVVLDAYNRHIDQTAFAREALESSTARYKFVCMHEPAIPASERCWHFLKSAPEEQRNAFLKVLAENKAFFLCGHLHRYSVLRRKTEWGPIVQVMVTSVTSLHRTGRLPYRFSTADYGGGLVDRFPEFSPETADARRAKLDAEQPFVDYYQMTPLAGYGILTIDPRSGDVLLQYYAAFEEETPFDEINLSELYRSGTVSRK